MYQDDVRDYYDYTLDLYKVFWHGDTRAIHYGIWGESTKDLYDALLNTNRFLADSANVQSGEKVLDAGCGVGGSSFWLAKNKNVRVVGITISKKQLDKAKELAARFDLEKQTEFYLQDYTKTSFSDASFDIVWAIESVCHAEDKSAFLKEAYRLLRSGGRLAIADGFLERLPRNQVEEKKLKSFIKGMALDNLAQSASFENALNESGFKNIKNLDKTEAILPTAIKMARMSRWSWPVSVFTTWLHITPKLLAANNRAGIDQLYLFKNRLLSYRIFVAEK